MLLECLEEALARDLDEPPRAWQVGPERAIVLPVGAGRHRPAGFLVIGLPRPHDLSPTAFFQFSPWADFFLPSISANRNAEYYFQSFLPTIIPG